MNDKNELTEYMMKFKPVPLESIENIDLTQYEKIPFAAMSAFGGAFTAMAEKFRTVTQNSRIQVPSNLYAAFDRSGNPIKLSNTFHNAPSYYMGSYIENGMTAQSYFKDVKSLPLSKTTTLAVNPAFLFMAISMASIERKMDEIRKTNEAILNFLKDDKRAKLMGNFVFLESVIQEYCLNIGDQTFKDSMHVKILDIRQEAEQNIIFFQRNLQRQIDDKKWLVNGLTVKNQIKNLLSSFQDYRTALYTFGYSSFVEVMVLENFHKDYINAVINKIEERSAKYQEFFIACKEAVQSTAEKSIETGAIDAISKISGGLGKLVEKTPLISKTQLDENLIASGEKLAGYKDKRVDSITNQLTGAENNVAQGFAENLKIVKKLYNEEVQVLLDDENLYLA